MDAAFQTFMQRTLKPGAVSQYERVETIQRARAEAELREKERIVETLSRVLAERRSH